MSEKITQSHEYSLEVSTFTIGTGNYDLFAREIMEGPHPAETLNRVDIFVQNPKLELENFRKAWSQKGSVNLGLTIEDDEFQVDVLMAHAIGKEVLRVYIPSDQLNLLRSI
jgi:hypothetical protein